MNNCTGILKITDKDISQSLPSVVHFVAAVRIILRNWWAAINADFMAGNRSVSRAMLTKYIGESVQAVQTVSNMRFRTRRANRIQLNQKRNSYPRHILVRRTFITEHNSLDNIFVKQITYILFYKGGDCSEKNIYDASRGEIHITSYYYYYIINMSDKVIATRYTSASHSVKSYLYL